MEQPTVTVARIGRPKGSKNGQRTLVPLVCAHCGAAFGVKPSAAASGRRFCSRVCVDAAAVRRIVLRCEHCGGPYDVAPHDAERQKHCSRRCSLAARQARRRATAPGINESTLHHIYEVERLTTRQIGARFGVSKTEVRRWMLEFGITPRPKSRGLAHRGIEPPTADELRHLVQVEFQGYREIAERYGVDHTAVPQWLKRHGITPNTNWATRRRGRPVTLPPADELRRLYAAGESLTSIGTRFGESGRTVRGAFRRHGIEVRPDGWDGGRRFTCADGHRARSTYELRVDNWLHEHGVEHSVEPAIPCDRRYHADFLANGWYIEVWGVIGSESYDRRKDRKRALYARHGLPLIEIHPHFFDSSRNDLWARRMVRVLTRPVQLHLALAAS